MTSIRVALSVIEQRQMANTVRLEAPETPQICYFATNIYEIL